MDFSLIVETDNVRTDNIENIVKRSFDMGYECVALNTIINSKNLSGKNINIPNPTTVNFEGKFGRKFRILSRLTAIIEDPIHAHNMLKNPITKKYDILAFQPVGDDKVLLQLVTQFDADIICLNLSENLGFTLKKSHVSVALQKRMCFEISYSPCLRSQTCKRSIISNSHDLVNVCKGKNIIVSSGALGPLDLRSPADVSNLSLLFGFKKNQAVECVKKTGHIVMSHAGTRKNTGLGFVSITGCLKIPKQQGWIVKMCKAPPLPSTEASKRKKHSLEIIDGATDEPKAKKCKVENKN